MADQRSTFSAAGLAAADWRQSFKIDNSTIVYDVTKSGGSASVGLAVTASTDGTVALCADGDMVLGKLIEVFADNWCLVQVAGGMTLPGGASATLTIGRPIVGALGASSAKGYIRIAAAPTGSYVQGTAEDTQRARGVIVENDTTTAVQVIL